MLENSTEGFDAKDVLTAKTKLHQAALNETHAEQNTARLRDIEAGLVTKKGYVSINIIYCIIADELAKNGADLY